MSDIISHYTETPEDDRLRSGWGVLELARTQELLRRYLPPPPRTILDIGGGSGIYSAWLGSLGYRTHLIDIVPRHIESARHIGEIASAEIGDARGLSRADRSADAVLLLGPLYHLTERSDRVRALKEARRVLRPGGPLFAAAISRFGSLFDGLTRGFIDDPAFAPILRRDLRQGQHRNPTERPEYFTRAFFHRPEQLRAEFAEAGFSWVELFAVEGPGYLARDFEARWADLPRRKMLLDLVRQVEGEEILLGVSPHWLAVGRFFPAREVATPSSAAEKATASHANQGPKRAKGVRPLRKA
ncbi:MAG TPA: methyltransferase domain-containing protein [Candidatus Cybelea sp.]|nr:methyltransferase domain-containing protein [Candidatus Cybelea sp.]